ncbi:MAG: hypothetical protein ABW173_08675 [Sphingomonas sp.]
MPTERMPETPWRWPVLLLIAAALVFAVGRAVFDTAPQAPAPPDRHPAGGAPRDYPAASRLADQNVAAAEALAATRSGEWLIEEKRALALIARGRLTGSFEDYAAAQTALDHAFATAPAGAGPHRTQAVLDFTLHRLARASAALDAIDRYAVPPEAEVQAELVAMRGDIALYRGRYGEATRHYAAARARGGYGGLLYRQAVYDARTGRPDAALAAVDTIERQARLPHAQFLANLALLRGTIELQRGGWEAAAAHFRRADRLFPGSWLIRAHDAQMLALAGDVAGAAARLEPVARASGEPAVMDALAGLYRGLGDHRRSQAWAARAGALWRHRLALLPEAAYGHAVEHELAFGDPARALALAAADYRARPYAASAVALGWALLANNRPADALRIVAPVSRSPWVSADQHIVAAQALLLLGRGEEAEREQAAARAINPHALDGNAALIWFGH